MGLKGLLAAKYSVWIGRGYELLGSMHLLKPMEDKTTVRLCFTVCKFQCQKRDGEGEGSLLGRQK